MVSTDLFQAFRWAENGASGEQRENNKRAGIEKESNMSILHNGVSIFTVSVFDLLSSSTSS